MDKKYTLINYKILIPKFDLKKIRYGEFHELLGEKEPAKIHEEYVPLNDKDEENYINTFLNSFIEKCPQMTKGTIKCAEPDVYWAEYITGNDMVIYHYMIIESSNDINNPDDIMLFIKGDEYLYFGTECIHGFYTTKNISYFESDGSTSISIGNKTPLCDKLKIVKDELSIMIKKFEHIIV